MKKIRSLIIILGLLCWVPSVIRGGEAPAVKKIDRWLMLGPAPVTLLENRVYPDQKSIADHEFIDVTTVLPEPGKKVQWRPGSFLSWTRTAPVRVEPEADSIYYFAVFPDVYKRMKSTLVVSGVKESYVDVYYNGVRVKKDFDREAGKVKAELDMLNQKNILLLKVLVPAGKGFIPDAGLTDCRPDGDGIVFSDDLSRRVNFRNVINMTGVGGAEISPDGKLAFLTLRRTDLDGETITWNEVIRTLDGKTIYSTAGSGALSGVKWMRDSVSISYTEKNKDVTSIHRFNIFTGEKRRLAKGIKNFSGYRWSPDNSFLIYTCYFSREKGEGFEYIGDIPERAQSPVYLQSAHIFFPEGGVTHTIGKKEDDLGDPLISPDGRKVILQKNIPDNMNPPYHKTLVYLLDTGSFSLDPLFESNHANPLMWSPDSKKILVTGGPSAFGGIGKVLPEGVIPNDFDTQAFIFDPETKTAEPLTKDFDPSVNTAFWGDRDSIYFSVTESSFEKLYRYSLPGKRFTALKTPVDVTGRVWFSPDGRSALYWGSGASLPHKLYRTDLRSGRSFMLKDYNREDFKHVRFGAVKDWDFSDASGRVISGHVYYPVDFDPGKKYPCIVYYYGGTSPVERSFGGRYPFNWYAANGYIVYVLQPSGTVGYGQAVSAVHVNDWGKTTSREVIAATGAFLAAHPFVDPGRVGAMGASYGGFLTQYLATQTDIFSAFISHAGISALSSYWGVGDWGYTYSGVATAGSFPWNRKDIYVGQSPLFMADRINTPLLLLHGDKDNNVPPGESYQMFAALKLLGKEVALVTIDDQAHWILDYKKRIQWMQTIMAWFDKWLKKDPFYWDSLYGKYEKKK